LDGCEASTDNLRSCPRSKWAKACGNKDGIFDLAAIPRAFGVNNDQSEILRLGRAWFLIAAEMDEDRKLHVSKARPGRDGAFNKWFIYECNRFEKWRIKVLLQYIKIIYRPCWAFAGVRHPPPRARRRLIEGERRSTGHTYRVTINFERIDAVRSPVRGNGRNLCAHQIVHGPTFSNFGNDFIRWLMKAVMNVRRVLCTVANLHRLREAADCGWLATFRTQTQKISSLKEKRN
jgi:hypothetical protein